MRGFLQVMGYGVANGAEFAMDFVIGESDHPKAFPRQEPRSGTIVSTDFVRSMLAAIKLDDQLCLEAHEIRDIGTDRLLATEFVSSELPTAQGKP